MGAINKTNNSESESDFNQNYLTEQYMNNTFTDKRTFSPKNHCGDDDVANTLNCKLKQLSRIEIHFIHWKTLRTSKKFSNYL